MNERQKTVVDLLGSNLAWFDEVGLYISLDLQGKVIAAVKEFPDLKYAISIDADGWIHKCENGYWDSINIDEAKAFIKQETRLKNFK